MCVTECRNIDASMTRLLMVYNCIRICGNYSSQLGCEALLKSGGRIEKDEIGALGISHLAAICQTGGQIGCGNIGQQLGWTLEEGWPLYLHPQLQDA